MLRRLWQSALTTTLLLVAGAGEAAPIPTLWSTGFDGAGALIAPGSATPDGHYSLISAPAPYGPEAFVLQDKDGNGDPVFPFGCCWFPSNSGDSQWLAPTNVLAQLPANGAGDLGSHEPGTYIYRTTFDLSAFDFPSTAFVIDLYWESDNDGSDPASTSIWLNGVQIPNSSACCKHQFTGPITLASGFLPADNTLDFYVENLSYSGGGNPTGIRVEAYGSATPVPEPSTLLLVGSAAVVAGTVVRRMRRRS